MNSDDKLIFWILVLLLGWLPIYMIGYWTVEIINAINR